MKFEPIAIVGQGCLFPGATTPEALWRIVAESRATLAEPEAGAWRLSHESSRRGPDGGEWSICGGYIRDFEPDLNRMGLQIDPARVRRMDRMMGWLLHAASDALRETAPDKNVRARTGAVIGNLSLPTVSLSRYAEHVWLKGQMGRVPEALLAQEIGEPPHPINRFMSGYPAHLLAEALGLGGGAFCLDAACASSLYAIKLACDRLHDGSADLMLAGAVNATDPLFLHTGFRALRAISPTGQSRPFHPEADGLVPSEGCGFVALKRLADAESAGDRIVAVIRGIGLSNDGGHGGLLSPAKEGQIRAMRQAYDVAGLSPADISLIECHATGTQLGDAVEIQSMSDVFAGRSGIPIGSIKGNIGHPVTAAGMAGLMKLIRALDEGVYPATRSMDGPIRLLEGTPFRLPVPGERWAEGAPRRAALSGFGFGGNNAHLIVERYEPGRAANANEKTAPAPADQAASRPAADVAIVGIGVSAGDRATADDWAAALFGARQGGAEPAAARARAIELMRRDITVPPVDLKQALPQQTALLRTAAAAAAEAGELPAERTGVYIGMQCDAEIARHIARVRAGEWARKLEGPGGAAGSDGPTDSVQNAFCGPLEAPTVVGLLPNVPANRLNKHLKLAGPGFTVSSEELSGLTALELACRALRCGELDAALAGAVDLSCEAVHQAAASAVLESAKRTPGDAAVVLALKRLDDARRDGNTVYAVLPGHADRTAAPDALSLGSDDGAAVRLEPVFGHAHAASGLLHVAAGALALHCGLRPYGTRRSLRPWLRGAAESAERAVRVDVSALGGAAGTVLLREREGGAAGFVPQGSRLPQLYTYAAADRRELLQAVREGRESRADGGLSGHAVRLAIVAGSAEEGAARHATAAAELERLISAAGPAPATATASAAFRDLPGVFYGDRPAGGETAFVFAGAAAAYTGMGGELLAAIPELADDVRGRFRTAAEAAGWLYEDSPARAPSPLERLGGASYLTQVHAAFTQRWLGLRPQAAIGLSSGETNALAALGAWRELDGLFADLKRHGIYSRELAGAYRVLQEAWGEPNPSWTNWRVLASPDAVRAALASEPRAHLTMIHAPEDCVLGGEPAACRRVLDRLKPATAYPLGYDMVVHSPELATISTLWRNIHRRPTSPVPGVRFYSGVTAKPYEPDDDAAADALLAMGGGTVDLPRTILRAWEDGVRVFVEHGPRGLCSGWIDQALAGREHVCVALDRPGAGSLEQAVSASAKLFAAGANPDVGRLQARLAELAADRAPDERNAALTLPAHLPPVVLPPLRIRTPDDERERPNRPKEVTPLNNIQQPLPQPPGSPAGPIGATPAAGTLAEPYAQIADAHRRYMELQASMQHRMLQMLAGHRAPPPAAPASAMPPAAVAAIRETAASALMPPLAAPPSPAPSPGAAAQRAAATPAPAAPPEAAPEPVPVRFTREQLEVLASGNISDVFGPAFAEQDRFARQVRMPEPPLLLADRVTELSGEPLSMGLGSIRTETDVRSDSWYLHKGRMPFGIMIESGQADLLLISWLGIDRLNRGERVYRLLGCELTFHGSLPAPGETLRYDIRVDSHAKHGDIRLFFFRYDCTDERGGRRMTMRQGQAGFFTDEELRESGGVIWEASAAEIRPDARLDPPQVRSAKSRFTPQEVRAFASGDLFGCFGEGYAFARTHTSSPSIQSGRMLLLDEVTAFATEGGPLGRGYLRAETRLSGDEWFFAGHFKNDPAMPGTLMLEGCVQAMSFYVAGLGYTLRKDGCRFEPAPDRPYRMICRGQVTPASRHLLYEVFVQEVLDGPEPTLVADVLLTVDGLKAFHCSRLAVRLVADFPLETDLRHLAAGAAGDPRAASADGVAFDYYSLLACAFGKPSHAFGSRYGIYDGGKHVPRLPGPPYHFMTRVTKAGWQLGVPKTGTVIEAEYDIPPDAWYFAENGSRTMPFCVLLEAALQPCGWLASYLGIPESPEQDAYFRNLDGKATQRREVLPHAGTLTTRVKLTSLSRMGHTYIEAFQVDCYLADDPATPVFTMSTVFGHFTLADLSNQVGLGASDAARERLLEPSGFEADLRNDGWFSGRPASGAKIAEGKLRMIDRVTGHWSGGGKYGKGRTRAEKTVEAGEWFFKAHFYRDPVQPGSLGVEAMIQLLQFHMLQEGMDAGLARPRFEPLGTGMEIVWKYRGQVTPSNGIIVVDLDVMETGRDERGVYATAEASLWVDGLQIYHVPSLGMRLVDDGDGSGAKGAVPSPALAPANESEAVVAESLFDPAAHPWIRDHRPTYTAPAMPSTFMLELMAAAVRRCEPEHAVVGAADVAFKRWLVCDRPRRLRTEVRRAAALEGADDGTVWYDAVLLAWRDASDERLSRFEEAASGRFALAPRYPAAEDAGAGAAFPPLADPLPADDPYRDDRLFHGPAFRIATRWICGINGASLLLDAGRGDSGIAVTTDGTAPPTGCLHPLLLDGATHAIPHDDLRLWSSAVAPDTVAYPHRLTSGRFCGPAPTAGDVRCEVRFDGFEGGERYPAFRIRLYAADKLWAELRLVEVLMPKGPLGRGDGKQRRDFLQNRLYAEGMGLSRREGERTALTEAEVRGSDWFPGTVAAVYGVDPAAGCRELTRLVAVKDHVARIAGVHPSTIAPGERLDEAVSSVYPYVRFKVAVEETMGEIRVASEAPPQRDIEPAMAYWRRKLGRADGWLGEDLYRALIGSFVGRFTVEDPVRFAEASRGPVLYLANHQTAVESLLFACLAEGLTGSPVAAIAKKEHGESWIGRLLSHMRAYPDLSFPSPIVYVDRADQGAMLQTVKEIAERMREGGASILVHVEGTRALAENRDVTVLSAVWLDLAIQARVPIVPVRFAGGLPEEAAAERLEFPAGYGRQSYTLGRPILPDELKALPLPTRKQLVLDALNAAGRLPAKLDLGGDVGNAGLAEAAQALKDAGAAYEQAVMLAALARLEGCSEEGRKLLRGLSQGRLRLPDEPAGRWLADIASWLYGAAGPKAQVTKRRKSNHADNV